MGRYLLMNDDSETEYKDIFSSNIENFVYSTSPTPYVMTQERIQMFARFMFELYGSSEFDDLVLSINNINYLGDLHEGDIILLPSLQDLQRFVRKNRK
jgi:hypothetical protein